MTKPKLKVITSENDYRRSLKAIEAHWDAKPGSEAHDSLEALVLLVDDYEKRAFPMEALIPRHG